MTGVEFEFWLNLAFALRRAARAAPQGPERANLQQALLYAERKWRSAASY